jgi:hypothetical protein
MAYIGNNPKLKSIVSSGDLLANLTAEPRVAGRLVYATDEAKFYVDDGVELSEVGSGGFNAIDTKANLDLLAREQGKIYYATDEDTVYTDDGTQLVQLGNAGGISTLQKGALLTSDGTQNGEFEVGTDGNFLQANSAQTSGLEWATVLQVPIGGTTGQILTKTATGYEWQDAPSGGGGGMQINTTTTLTSQGTSYTVPANNFAYVSVGVTGGGTSVVAQQTMSVAASGNAISMNNGDVTIAGGLISDTFAFRTMIVVISN